MLLSMDSWHVLFRLSVGGPSAATAGGLKSGSWAVGIWLLLAVGGVGLEDSLGDAVGDAPGLGSCCREGIGEGIGEGDGEGLGLVPGALGFMTGLLVPEGGAGC